MTRLEKLEQKIKELERKLCCKTQFFDTFDDFHEEGATGVLYIDEETGDIYIWDGVAYVTADSSSDDMLVAKTIYVDATYGDDTTGTRENANLPFETFTNALLEYQDGDWIKYENSDQTISGTNILPSATTHFYDFGGGVTTISGTGIFIGSGFTPVIVKHTFIKSDGTINTGTKVLSSNRNGSFTLKANKVVSSGSLLVTKHNVVIDVNEWTTTILGATGFHSGNNTTNYTTIKSIFITNSSIGSYASGILQVEASGESSNNAAYYVNIGNVVMNTEMGHLISVSASSQIINDALVDFNVGTVKQISVTYDPLVHTTYQYCLFHTNTSAGTINNSSFTYKFNNIESDLSLFKFRANSTFNGCNTLLDGNSIINKGHLFHVNPPSTTTLNNSKIIVKGNHTVVNNAISGIQISGLTLNTGSIVIFDCNYSGVSNISLTNLVIDATSKIIFRGIWNLGSGYFDLSGVTGAGADNVYFENCTIITSGTNCIDAGSAKNIKVINTYSNKIESVNITTLIEPIVVNAVIN